MDPESTGATPVTGAKRGPTSTRRHCYGSQAPRSRSSDEQGKHGLLGGLGDPDGDAHLEGQTEQDFSDGRMEGLSAGKTKGPVAVPDEYAGQTAERDQE